MIVSALALPPLASAVMRSSAGTAAVWVGAFAFGAAGAGTAWIGAALTGFCSSGGTTAGLVAFGTGIDAGACGARSSPCVVACNGVAACGASVGLVLNSAPAL